MTDAVTAMAGGEKSSTCKETALEATIRDDKRVGDRGDEGDAH
jgi:hypothetical protein